MINDLVDMAGFEEALAQSNERGVVVLKHSNVCPRSFTAQSEVQEYANGNPDVPVYRVVIQEHRAVSNGIADQTGVEHKSPQVLILSGGQVAEDYSHEGITADRLRTSVSNIQG